jgi:hypothetical protein
MGRRGGSLTSTSIGSLALSGCRVSAVTVSDEAVIRIGDGRATSVSQNRGYLGRHRI